MNRGGSSFGGLYGTESHAGCLSASLHQMSELQYAPSPSPHPLHPKIPERLKTHFRSFRKSGICLFDKQNARLVCDMGNFFSLPLTIIKSREEQIIEATYFLMMLCHRQLRSYSCCLLTQFPFPFTMQWTVTGFGFLYCLQ